MSTTKQPSTVIRKIRIFISLLTLLAILVVGLLYFLMTGKKPTNFIPIADIQKPTYMYSIYGNNDATYLQKPLGIAVNPKNNIVYASDNKLKTIRAYNSQGDPLFSFKKIKVEGKDKELIEPIYIALNQKDNNVYVSDSYYAAIFIFNEKGKFVKQFIPNNNKKFPWVPLGMAFDKENNFYVADKGLHRIVKFDSKGKLLLSVGKQGAITKETTEKPGDLNFPNSVVVDEEGLIYVSDSNNQRVQIFDQKAKLKKIIKVEGMPRGLSVIDGGSSAGIYVVNLLDNQIQAFNKNGENLYIFGETGAGDGQFNYPNDIKIEGNNIFIADKGNNRIQVWRF